MLFCSVLTWEQKQIKMYSFYSSTTLYTYTSSICNFLLFYEDNILFLGKIKNTQYAFSWETWSRNVSTIRGAEYMLRFLIKINRCLIIEYVLLTFTYFSFCNSCIFFWVSLFFSSISSLSSLTWVLYRVCKLKNQIQIYHIVLNNMSNHSNILYYRTHKKILAHHFLLTVYSSIILNIY